MIARVTTIHGSQDHVEIGIREFKEGFTAAAKDHPGFRGAHLLVDRKNGKFIGITLWNTKANIQASAEGAAAHRAQLIKSVAATTAPTVEIYEYIRPTASN